MTAGSAGLVETRLLEGLRAGDSDSFERLLSIHGGRLLATGARMLGDEQEAQDVVQETLIAAWKSIRDFQGTSSLATWLHRITINACLARLRTSRAKSEVSLSDDARPVSLSFEGLPTAWSEPGPDLETRLALRRTLQRALNLLPEEFRTVLLLRDVEELSSREVAERLNIPDATVRQRLHRARAAMAELLRPELCEGPELTCGGQFDLLMDYIDQALPPALEQPVAAHIASCVTCQPLHVIYRMTIGLPRAIAELTAMEATPAWATAGVARARGS